MSTFEPKRLIFDIETVGVNFDTLDKVSQEYLLGYAEDEDEEAETKERMSFSPLTGEIVAIGALNPDTNKGSIYVRTNNKEPITNAEIEEGIGIECGDERGIIEKFWEIAKSYNCFITFNGRAFDVPFLMIRSAALGIRPSKNLLSNRYVSSQRFDAVHIDLLDQLTFYGAVRRRFNLHLWSKAFGIKSPKEEGITGDDVGRLYKEGKLMEIVRYNLGDLRATKELYERWSRYLS